MLLMTTIKAQKTTDSDNLDFLSLKWKQVAFTMPDNWYSSKEACAVADNVLRCQKSNGGWAKNKPYHHEFTENDIQQLNVGSVNGATIDNGATITEMYFLAKVYDKTQNSIYKQSFYKALQFLLKAQYSNGGWPQFYPPRENVPYSAHITYNDNAMVNVLSLYMQIMEQKEPYTSLSVPDSLLQKIEVSFNKGIECILKTQIYVNNQPTVWCAQHHEVSLQPANARSYELASYSGAESAAIVLLLMELKSPSPEVINAVKGAVDWFKKHQIEGIRIEKQLDDEGRPNRVMVQDKNASALWARFYDLDTEKPFFCDRDGIKKPTLAEIGYERRNGYAWYITVPQIVLDRYENWLTMISND